jgi:hypothetical protein
LQNKTQPPAGHQKRMQNTPATWYRYAACQQYRPQIQGCLASIASSRESPGTRQRYLGKRCFPRCFLSEHYYYQWEIYVNKNNSLWRKDVQIFCLCWALIFTGRQKITTDKNFSWKFSKIVRVQLKISADFLTVNYGVTVNCNAVFVITATWWYRL